jgi:hypothetical protein
MKKSPRLQLHEMIAQRLRDADLLDILLADPRNWPAEAIYDEQGAIMDVLAKFEAGAAVILTCFPWPNPPQFWATSHDGERRVAIDPAWLPDPGDTVHCTNGEDYIEDGKPRLIPSARLTSLEIMCAIADVRFAVERGARENCMSQMSRLGWYLCQLHVLFDYGRFLDRSVGGMVGSSKGGRTMREARENPMKDRAIEHGKMLMDGGHSAKDAARLGRARLERERAGDKVPAARTIREWLSKR